MTEIQNSLMERHHQTLTAIFFTEDMKHLEELLSPDLNVDLPMDAYGHTALHWAAALGKVQLLELLISHGADLCKVNNDGESALIRAVLVTHSYEAQTFPTLLEILTKTIGLSDKKNRTVFHHIAMTAAYKSHAASAEYYMECLARWINGHSLNGVIPTIVNVQDNNGDSALNIAAKHDNERIVRLLLELGADRKIENRVGVKPEDYESIGYVEERSEINDRLHEGMESGNGVSC
jgi:regulatory protein SWI6